MSTFNDFKNFEFGKLELQTSALNSIFGGERATEYGSTTPSGYVKEGNDRTEIDGHVCTYTVMTSGPLNGQSTNLDTNTGCG